MINTVLRHLSKRFHSWLMVDDDPPGYPLCDFQRIQSELRTGDVILIEGRSRVSHVIGAITQSPWTHSALYIGHLHEIDDPKLRDRAQSFTEPTDRDKALVLESLLGKGTIITPLDYYRADHIRICRPRGLRRQDIQLVIGYVVEALGVEYDVRQILDLARLLLPWSIVPRHWRSTLFEQRIGTPTRQICSTLIAQAFASVDYPILPLVKIDPRTGMEFIPRNPRLYTPSDFDYSPYFDIIKYPMFDFDEESSYRDLPWNRDGLLSNDKRGVISTINPNETGPST